MHDLFGQPAPFAQLGGPLADLLVQRFERRVVVVERLHFLGRHHDRREVAFAGGVLKRRGPLLALQQQLHAAEPALDLPDPRDDAHRVENVWRGLVGVVALRDREDESLVLERGFDRAQRPRPAGRNGRGEARENHRPAQWQDR